MSADGIERCAGTQLDQRERDRGAGRAISIIGTGYRPG
jgi:hypothetical protein